MAEARYATVDHLASGGMGELHLARVAGEPDLGIERLVVTKRLRVDVLEDERAALMLVDEARTAATLYHRNIVQVLDIVLEGDHVVLVLEYFPSMNLAQLLDAIGGPMSYPDACAVVTEIAAGLHYAHERTGDDGAPLDIVHRDVSLPNILIGDHGHVKLTDFGIAKARSRLYVTRSESIKGKLGYMPPEQIRSSPPGAVDRRADIFALGVVLFEASTGVPLFTAGSDYETMRKIIEGEVVEPASVRAGFPDDLAAVIRRAISGERDERHATAEDFAGAVRAVAATHGWLPSTTALRQLVARHAPEGVPPWRRPSVMASAAWTERTTRRWRDG